MKILYIHGDCDFAALEFETKIKVKKALQIIGPHLNIDIEIAPDIYGKILEFKDVDPEFIQFIRDEVQDYDQSKHSNFYEIK